MFHFSINDCSFSSKPPVPQGTEVCLSVNPCSLSLLPCVLSSLGLRVGRIMKYQDRREGLAGVSTVQLPANIHPCGLKWVPSTYGFSSIHCWDVCTAAPSHPQGLSGPQLAAYSPTAPGPVANILLRPTSHWSSRSRVSLQKQNRK